MDQSENPVIAKRHHKDVGEEEEYCKEVERVVERQQPHTLVATVWGHLEEFLWPGDKTGQDKTGGIQTQMKPKGVDNLIGLTIPAAGGWPEKDEPRRPCMSGFTLLHN